MPSLQIKAKTSLSPEQFLAALTDFGSERGAIWGNSQPSHFIVHRLGVNHAVVTEGSKVFGGVWERLHYDWSELCSIKLTTIDSNIWAEGSGWHYKLKQADDGSETLINAKVTRYPCSKKGYLILIVVASVGRPLIKRSFNKTLRAIEKQSDSSR